MAKKRKRKSSKCPEPFNTLIDLAAAATLDYVDYKRRQKRGTRELKLTLMRQRVLLSVQV